MIIILCEWDDGVQAIVTTGQLKDNENGAVFPRDGLGDRVGGEGVEREKCFLNENRQGPAGGRAQERRCAKIYDGFEV